MQEADVVLVVGTKLGEVATAGWTVPNHEAKLIHVDIDAAVIGRNYRTKVGMAADAKLAIRDLLEQIRGKSYPSHENWVNDAAGFVDKWREMVKKKMEPPADPIRPEYVIHAIREVMSPDEPLVSDASFPTVWTGAYFDVLRSGRVYTAPRGAGGTGGGFPLSLGFQTALPDKRVFCVAGDCGFSVVCQELETAARIGLHVITIVLNNSSLGYIRHEQKAFYSGRFVSTEFRRVDFAKVAEGFGCLGIRVEKAEELSDALKQAKNNNGPAVLDVIVDPWAYPPILEFLSSGWNEELAALMKV
jgi:acetolactate synthase-1/2/3 large subunit